MASFHPNDLVEKIKADSIRVRAPSSVVFLCGGVIDAAIDPAPTLRDAFFRTITSSPLPYRIVLAEDAEPLTSDAGYGDLLSFESDIAGVVGLILLFAESAGSLAELGAFAALKEVGPALLAILDEFHYAQSSFIRNGPIKFLENQYGDEWILVLERDDVGIASDGTLKSLKPLSLVGAVAPAISKRLASRSVLNKFDKDNGGHAILLMTGLCQEFGALTTAEVKNYLKRFGVEVTPTRLKNFIYCAELLGWLKTVRKGNHIFFVATGGDFCLDFSFEPGTSPKEKVRWRTDIRSFWQVNDPTRMRAISEVIAATKGKKP